MPATRTRSDYDTQDLVSDNWLLLLFYKPKTIKTVLNSLQWMKAFQLECGGSVNLNYNIIDGDFGWTVSGWILNFVSTQKKFERDTEGSHMVGWFVVLLVSVNRTTAILFDFPAFICIHCCEVTKRENLYQCRTAILFVIYTFKCPLDLTWSVMYWFFKKPARTKCNYCLC